MQTPAHMLCVALQGVKMVARVKRMKPTQGTV